MLRLLQSVQKSLLLCNSGIQAEIIILIDSPENTIHELEMLLSEIPDLHSLCTVQVFYNEKNLGVAQTRNKGLALAKGEYIHLIDQDDEVHPDFYNKVSAVLQNHDWVLVNGLFQFDLVQKSQKIYYLKPALTLHNFVTDDFLRSPGQVVFARKLKLGKAFISVPNSAGADDRFFWIQQFALNPNMRVAYLSDPLYIAHIHNENFSADSMQLYQCCLSIWEEWDYAELPIPEKWIYENVSALKYILGKDKSLTSFWFYIKYKYKLNRMIRFVVKRVLLS
ncbi:MAG: glycosyltransferase [Bacteroidia bacterium]|nr:glycosyltransferase [Bacteroidia bacterium]